MKKVFYEKVGRKYVPVHEYDKAWMDGFPKGNHLIMCYPGGQSRKYHIDPNYAAMIAAVRVAEDKICSAIVKASEVKPTREPITEGQLKAWKKLQEEFGDDLLGLRGVTINACVQAGTKAMIEEAEKLLTVPAVKAAFEHFLFVAELTKEHTHD